MTTGIKRTITPLILVILLLAVTVFGVFFVSSDCTVHTAVAIIPTGTHQTMVNTVIFARFEGEGEWLTEEKLEAYDLKFNTSNMSVKSYWETMSFGRVTYETRFATFGEFGSFETSRPRAHFSPRYEADRDGNVANNASVINKYGYNNRTLGRGNNARPHVDVFYRRQSLLVELIEMASDYINAEGKSNPNFGGAMENRANSFTFIFGGSPDRWADMLWPHQFQLFFSTSDAFITHEIPRHYHVPAGFWDNHDRDIFLQGGIDRAGLAGKDGTILPSRYVMSFDDVNFNRGNIDRGSAIDKDENDLGFLGVSVHETAHILGLPDLYNYENHNNNPFGRWDLMDNTAAMPQTLNSYFRYRLGWIDGTNMPTITESQTGLTLTASAIAGQNEIMAYKLKSPVFENEYFIVEFKGRFGTWDGSQYYRPTQSPRHSNLHYALPGEGLLIYRVDTRIGFEGNQWVGNMHGPPNMMEVMRGGRRIDEAHLDGFRRTSIGYAGGIRDNSQTLLSYQGSSNNRFRNWNSQIVISNVRIDGTTLTFDVSIPVEDEVVLPPRELNLFSIIPFCGDVSAVELLGLLGVLLFGVSMIIIKRR